MKDSCHKTSSEDWVKARTPFKVLQATTCSDSHSAMATAKKCGLPSRTGASRQFLHGKCEKSALSGATKDPSLPRPGGLPDPSRRSPLPSSCDKTPSSKTSPSFKRRSEAVKNPSAEQVDPPSDKKQTEASGYSTNSVHSLMCSPKWSRIKDKFESGENVTKNTEPSKFRSLSENLTTTSAKGTAVPKNFTSNFASKSLSTKTLCNGSLAASKTDSNSRVTQFRGSYRSSQDSSQVTSPTTKANGTATKTTTIRSVPISARSAATPLLPNSSHVNSYSKRSANSDRTNVSSSKYNCNSSSASSSSSSSSSLPSKTDNRTSSIAKIAQSKSTSKGSETEKQTVSSESMARTSGSKKSELSKSGNPEKLKSSNKSELQSNFDPHSGSQNLKNSSLDRPKSQAAQSLAKSGSKNIWVKDKSGNWIKSTEGAEKDVDTSDKRHELSKVSVLRNKFSSLSSSTDGSKCKNCTSRNSVPANSETSRNNVSHTSDETVCEGRLSPKNKNNLSSSHFSNKFSPNSEERSGSSDSGDLKSSNTSFRSSLTTSSCSSDGSENTSNNSTDRSPDKVRKLSLVQRAVLSYEENLSLLSPETQRKLKLLGEKIRAQAENDELFLSSKSTNIQKSPQAVRCRQDPEANSPPDGEGEKSKVNSSQLGEPVEPVQTFLSKYRSTQYYRKLDYNTKNTNKFAESKCRTESPDCGDISSKDFTNSDASSCVSESSEKTSSESTLNSTISTVSVKALRQRFGSQVQDTTAANSRNQDTLKMNNLQKKSGPRLQPNPSFLWRNSSSESSNASTDRSKNNNKENDYHKYYVLENYYSPLDYANDDQKPDDNLQEYASSNLAPKLTGGEACYQNLSSSDSSTQGKHADDDDAWTDMSEEEDTRSKSNSSKSSTLKKKKNNKKHSHSKGQLPRTWSQSFREMAKAELRKDAYQPYCHKDKSKPHEASDSGNAGDADHLYEPVYESLNNYQCPDRDDGHDDQSLSPDEEHGKDTFSSYTSLESLHSDKVEGSQESDRNRPKSPQNSENKKPGGKMRNLRRHLSWTKSDIKLELSSKFNKIKIKKHSPHSTEIGLRMQENSAASTSPKKNTFIKCILKQKSAGDIPVKKSPSPKKESAHFYVHLSMTSAKQRPFSDSHVPGLSSQLTNSEQSIQESRKSSEPILSTHYRVPGSRLRKGSSSQVVRPTSPPPLPPTQGVTKPNNNNCPEKQPVANPSSLHDVFARERSSERKPENSSAQDPAPMQETYASKTGLDNPPAYSDIEYKNPSSLYATIDSLQRKRNSVGSSASFESCYAMADESGSSGASTSTTYSSGFTLQIESDFAAFHVRNTGSRQSNLSLPLVKDCKTEAVKSPFEEEPLYQFYHKNAQERATMWYMASGSESEFEDVLEEKSIRSEDVYSKPASLQSQTSAMDLIRSTTGQRTLWCEVPEVRSSNVLETISAQDRKLQEAMFEVITSEASYLKSLNFLMEHFVQCPEFSADESNKHILDKRERHILFSDVPPVRDVSASLLGDLEKRWLENIVISDVCDIVYNHASKYFSVYVKYCSNQIYQDRTLKQLKETRPAFVEVLKRLESSPVCQGLDMHSFLMLPMQRITRLPLLIDAIFHRLSSDSSIYESCKMALGLLNKLVAECNEGARKMERMEEMLVISHQLDFKDCKGLGLLSASRWLVKKGELIQLVSDTSSKKAFGRNTRWGKIRLFLFLFTDLLVVTKKKSDDSYCVIDYCPRNMVQVMLIDENTPGLVPSRLPSSCKNIFQLIMLSNKEGKTVEMLLSCVLESDRTRWMNAVTPPQSQNPDEKIYEEWDCPQVQCTHAYTAQQPDELSIEEADVVNVFRKIADGWYEGERIRDGQRGWFPSSHTVEIVSSHVRARNLRQRYRLLMLSQTFLEEQQKAMAVMQAKGK